MGRGERKRKKERREVSQRQMCNLLPSPQTMSWTKKCIDAFYQTGQPIRVKALQPAGDANYMTSNK